MHSGAVLDNVILLSGCDVGDDVRLSRVICDKNCRIEPGAQIGVDPSVDIERFPFRTPSGIVVLPKGTHVPRKGPVEFAFDIAELMRTDPSTRDAMQAFEGGFVAGAQDRHSYASMGPRYRRHGVSLSSSHEWPTDG